MKSVFRCATSFLLALSFIMVMSIAVALPESRSDPCAKLIHQESRSISELVSQAEYIGLYEVLRATKDDISLYNNRESYSYFISILRHIKGDTPRVADISGLEPLSNVPQDYFILDLQHEEIPEDDPERYGRSELLVSNDGERCLVAPRFMIGYKYLIFGGLDSSLAYEPVHHDSDPWYRRVVTEVQEENP